MSAARRDAALAAYQLHPNSFTAFCVAVMNCLIASHGLTEAQARAAGKASDETARVWFESAGDPIGCAAVIAGRVS